MSLIETVLGAYTQLSGEGIATVNWGWIASAVALLILLVCFFKLLGGLLKWMQ